MKRTVCDLYPNLHKGNDMLKSFKNIKAKILIPHLVITLAYPAVKAYISKFNRLMIFADSLLIVGGLLILIGVFYSLYLHGDFDHTAYTLRRGIDKTMNKTFEDYKNTYNEEREESFNYPLFLGILFVAASVIISYAFL